MSQSTTAAAAIATPSLLRYPDVFNPTGFASGVDQNLLTNPLPGTRQGTHGFSSMLSSNLTGSEELFDSYPRRFSSDLLPSTTMPTPLLSTSLTFSGQPNITLSERNKSFSMRSSSPAPPIYHAYYHEPNPTFHRLSSGLTNNLIAGTFKPSEERNQLLGAQMPFRVPCRPIGVTEHSTDGSINHSRNMNSSPSTQFFNRNITSQRCEPNNTPSTSLYIDPGPHAFPQVPHKKPQNSNQLYPPASVLMAIQQKSYPSQRNRQPPPPPLPPPPPAIAVPTPQSATARPDVVDPIESSQQPTVVHNRLEKKHGCWMCHKSFDRPSSTSHQQIL